MISFCEVKRTKRIKQQSDVMSWHHVVTLV